MVSKITLGNAFDSNGKTIIGGANTGFDTKTLVEGLASAKRQPAVRLEKKLEADAKKLTAFSDLQTTMKRFKDAAEALRNPPGVANAEDNVFEYRNTTLSTTTGASSSNYLTVTSAPGAAISTYDVQVGTLATYNIKTTNTFALTNADTAVVGATAPFRSGSLLLGASGVSVALTDGDTLQQVADHINAVSDQSNVQATILQVSSGNFRLQLKSTDTGTNMNYTTPGTALFPSGFALEQDAVNASITVDNTAITSQSNVIDDVIEGMTFTLLQPTGATHVNVNVEADTKVVKDAIMNFVNAYNDLKVFASKQTEFDEETGLPKDTAVLNNSSVMRSIVSNAVSEVSALVNGLSSPNSLADLGIAFDDFAGTDETPYTRNILKVDEEKLSSMLTSDFDSVRKIFEFDMSSSDTNVQVFSRSNALSISAFSLAIDVGAGTYVATYLGSGGVTTTNLTGTAISGGGILLSGASGSPLDGLQLIYSGAVNTTSVINITQGVGDRLFNSIDSSLNATTGSLTIEVNSITESDKRMKSEITRIDDIVEKYRQQMLDKFAKLEGLLGTTNSILASLEANANAQNG